MISRFRLATLAAALWAVAIPGAVLAGQAPRLVMAAAITATLAYYIDHRAAERDVLVRLGLWTGAAVERQRCTMVHDHDAKRGSAAAGAPYAQGGAVDSEAWPATQRDA